jgi:exo beta-1,2-glucooligosaccharide sophorohydrolase (non-reducing end)
MLLGVKWSSCRQAFGRDARLRGRACATVASGAAVLVLVAASAAAQGIRLFQDSSNPAYWDASWGYASGASQLALINVSHFPVDASHAYIGDNSLRLSWMSATGGDWMLTAATPSWVPFDTSALDTIVFALWSAQAIAAADLPDFLLEDANNVRTPRHPLADYVAGVPAGVWTRVAVPLAVFRANPGAANLTRINKVFFAQGVTNATGVAHTLFVDEIRFVPASVPPAAPSLDVRAFERHLEARWDPSVMPAVETMRIERQDGSQWVRLADMRPDDGVWLDWRGATGAGATYRLTAFGWDLSASPPSSAVAGTTHDMSQDEWLDMAEEAAFRYFWVHAHPTWGLARERYTDNTMCATGGTGMGIMALIAGAERGYAPRAAIAERVRRILQCYVTVATRYHGAFSHWVDGPSAASIAPDAPGDFKGDIVETSYLVQGALAARQYFDHGDSTETRIRDYATLLWLGVDWNAYRPNPPGDAVNWLWSPTSGFSTSFPVAGWNECLIVYLLATASPAHPVPAQCYPTGWARYGAMRNGKSFFGYKLWLGEDYGGPLFFAHYSFLGFDPRAKRDAYTNYVEQNRNHTLIDRAYCMLNPFGHAGYGSDIWGLTASDGPGGYAVHKPYGGDDGTLAPTAALSSMPYTPAQSLAALQAMYRLYGQRLYGPFGFRDAYNPSLDWYDQDYIAIDEGPIAVMIENFRSQLLWNCFMLNPEIQPALGAMGFVYDGSVDVTHDAETSARLALGAPSPNPCRGSAQFSYVLPASARVQLVIEDVRGREVARLCNGQQEAGRHAVRWDGRDGHGRRVAPGIYLVHLTAGGASVSTKLLMLH